MKLLLALAFSLSLHAGADQFKTVTQDLSSKNYDASISYPVFFANSVATGYAKINQDLRATLLSSGCDPDDAAQSQYGYDYSAHARVVALNRNYVGVEVSDDSYCGGAHPNYVTYNITFDAKSGEMVSMDQAFPRQNLDGDNVDWDAFNQYQLELATIMYDHQSSSDMEEDCGADLPRKEAIEQLQGFFPMVTGLAANKTVVIRTFPPHVATVCGFSVRVPYEVIKGYIAKGSVLNQWLKP